MSNFAVMSRYYLKDRVAAHGFKLFGRSVASSAESATAVMTTVSGIASQISVIPGGTLTARLGGRTVLALSFCVGAAGLTAYAFTTDFSVVLVRGSSQQVHTVFDRENMLLGYM